MRPRRLIRVAPAVCVIAGAAAFVLLSAGAAFADNTCAPGNEGDCKNTAGVVGTAAAAAATAAVATTVIRHRRSDPDETPEHRKECDALLARYTARRQTLLAEWEKLDNSITSFNNARRAALRTAFVRNDLREQRNEAVAYLAAAGMVAGGAAFGSAAAVARVAAALRNAATATYEAAGALRSVVTVGARAGDIVAASPAAIAQAELLVARAAAMSTAANTLGGAGGVGAGTAVATTAAGTGAGWMGGKLLQSMMDYGLNDFDEAFKTQLRVLMDWGVVIEGKRAEATGKLEELRRVEGELQRMCGIEVEGVELHPLSRIDPMSVEVATAICGVRG